MSDTFGTEGTLIPDLPAPIQAYRSWTHDEYRLSGNGGTVWPVGKPLEARCSNFQPTFRWSFLSTPGYPKTDHPCPSPTAKDHAGYGCGIYAYKTYAQARQHSGGLLGKVELGGIVYEHEGGYRAQYGMVVALYGFARRGYDPDEAEVAEADRQRSLERLATIYDVPIEEPPFYDELDEIRRRIAAEVAGQYESWDEARERALANPTEEVEGPTLSDLWSSYGVTTPPSTTRRSMRRYLGG